MSDEITGIAVVTGAGSGIGLEVARRFAGEGRMVVACGLEMPDDISAEPPNITFVQMDVCDEAALADLSHRIKEMREPVAALVNAAGVQVFGTAVDTDLAAWRLSLDVNMTGTFLVSSTILPHMTDGGSVVNISSVVALASGKRRLPYAAAKAGVIGMTRAMALDHAADGIRVNAICPGAVETQMLHKAWASVDPNAAHEKMRGSLELATPLGCVASPSDITDLIHFLCGPQSSFITGTSIPIDGGVTAQLAVSQAR